MREKFSVSRPWLIATVAMVLVIWGNSMMPGSDSSQMSSSVLDIAHALLQAIGLPYEWLTSFLVRKAAHFTEYAVLAVLASKAFDPVARLGRVQVLALAAFLVLVPALDETIQLFVPGRCGQPTDVLLDCCGALTGVVLRTSAARWLRRGADPTDA